MHVLPDTFPICSAYFCTIFFDTFSTVLAFIVLSDKIKTK